MENQKMTTKEERQGSMKASLSVTPKVLLVNPPVADIREPHDVPEFPALGLAYIAAVLEKSGLTPVCMDCKYDGYGLDVFARKLAELGHVDVVGITSMTHNIDDAHKVAGVVKRSNPKARVVIGGCHVTAEPLETLRRMPDFDAAVVGEGEESFPELLQAWFGGGDASLVPGLALRDGEEVLLTGKRDGLKDLDALPYPAWHLYAKPGHKLPVLSSRGCPYSCNFCMRVLGKVVRYRSAENVVDEIEHLIDTYGIDYIGFPDETFTLNKKRLHEVMDLIVERGLQKRFTWASQTRVDLVERKMLSAMKKAGCVLVGLGVESGNEGVLARSKKGINKTQAREAVALAKELGLKVNAYFILGHPDETVANMIETVRFAAELNPHFSAFGIMVPYPGTAIRDMALKGEGSYINVSTDWSDYTKSTGHPMELKGVSRRTMVFIQMGGYLYFYLRNLRLREFFGLLRENIHPVLLNLKKMILPIRG